MNSPVAMVLVDAHVHVHPQCDPAAMFDAAAENFGRAARRLNAGSHQGVLLLTEMAGIDWFESVLPRPGAQSRVGRWTCTASQSEDFSLHVGAAPAQSLIVIAGRQIVTAERIEVLALGTRSHIPDGQTLDATLTAARKAHATVVLPWAVGKWLGRRGKLVSAALRRAAELDLYAGDNAGRPTFWPEPEEFRIAAAQGRVVLPGTDPLPIRHAERRVGSMGFWMEGLLPPAMPAGALHQRLMSPGSQPIRAFGELESPWRFLRNQLALRFRKFQSR
jgi:hypothetical protein